jgi:hypothetical protein
MEAVLTEEPCEPPHVQPLTHRTPEGTARALPNGGGFLRVISGGKGRAPRRHPRRLRRLRRSHLRRSRFQAPRRPTIGSSRSGSTSRARRSPCRRRGRSFRSSATSREKVRNPGAARVDGRTCRICDHPPFVRHESSEIDRTSWMHPERWLQCGEAHGTFWITPRH